MPRTDDDSWDITESVGSTALGVAAARAAESASKNPLIEDPFARIFVEAAGTGTWQFYTDATLRAQLLEIAPEVRIRMQVMVDFMAVRTAFFDEFFLNAAKSGVRQVVILAAGLDARAWRLSWPERTTVYELDQVKVLEFKSATLSRHGARPTSTLVNVPVDLRQDWPTVLQEAGFDASRPSVWSAEGLVRYLPARSQDLLFERVDALSPVGSWLAVNAPSKNFLSPDLLARQRQLAERYHAAAAQLIRTEIPDTEDLWYPEERTDLPDWLRERGWDVSETTMAEMLGRYGRTIPEDGAMAPTDFIAAQRSG